MQQSTLALPDSARRLQPKLTSKRHPPDAPLVPFLAAAGLLISQLLGPVSIVRVFFSAVVLINRNPGHDPGGPQRHILQVRSCAVGW